MKGGPTFAFWRYELVPRRYPGRKREGALLRFEFGGGYGYADCHPWPELGDEPLAQQLEGMSSRGLTPLMERSWSLAMIDRVHRMNSQSLFSGLAVPGSHASIPDALDLEIGIVRAELDRLFDAGFREIKIKAGNEPTGDAERLGKLGPLVRDRGLKLRLDLNAKTDPQAASRLLAKVEKIADGLDWIDWIEDPCLFDSDIWRSFREDFDLRLAFDLAGNPPARELIEAADVIVVKPAVRNPAIYSAIAGWSGLPVCVTSYLDHPVGQAFAAWVAASKPIRGVEYESCGVLTQDVYEPTEFSERLGADGPRLIPPEGTGIGFDDLLEKLPWQELS